ncbi:putative Lea domain protein [Seiridium cardinale]|uniref:Lea domain protein n=1 Tax=Seiridium cardinale TaxID=138064 RepID=A0ABR2XD98_9PEZI
MSFLTETVTRRMALSSRAVFVQTPRQFSISARYQKSATETVKDAAKTVDRKVSDKLVDGINAASEVAQKTTGADVSQKVKGTAEEIRGEAKGKASELKGEAKGAANEAAGKAKGAAEKL